MRREIKDKGWYSPEFKQRAIALAKEIGATRAGPKLGLRSDTLRVWIWLEANGNKMKKDDSPEVREAKLAQREIQRLKRENDELKKANYVLKEVASFFSKDRPNSSLRRSLNSPRKKAQK